jgi:hypothetical protein
MRPKGGEKWIGKEEESGEREREREAQSTDATKRNTTYRTHLPK